MRFPRFGVGLASNILGYLAHQKSNIKHIFRIGQYFVETEENIWYMK